MTEEDIISMIDSAAKDYSREPTKEERLEKATIDELDELEDDEDDLILEMYRFVFGGWWNVYEKSHLFSFFSFLFCFESHLLSLSLLAFSFHSRQKRIAEMKQQATRNRFGTIVEIKVLFFSFLFFSFLFPSLLFSSLLFSSLLFSSLLFSSLLFSSPLFLSSFS